MAHIPSMQSGQVFSAQPMLLGHHIENRTTVKHKSMYRQHQATVISLVWLHAALPVFVYDVMFRDLT